MTTALWRAPAEVTLIDRLSQATIPTSPFGFGPLAGVDYSGMVSTALEVAYSRLRAISVGPTILGGPPRR